MLARFAVESNKVNKRRQVHWKLFYIAAPRSTGQLELSFSRVGDLERAGIIETGKEHVKNREDDKDKLYGWSLTKRKDLEKFQLNIQDQSDPPRHSIVTGWPEDREERRDVAKELAQLAVGFLLPEPIQVPCISNR